MYTSENKLYGTNKLQCNNTQWEHLYASDNEGVYSYTEKVASVDTSMKQKRPFGPVTAKNLLRKLRNPWECLIMFSI
jgi:hypothetical protein